MLEFVDCRLAVALALNKARAHDWSLVIELLSRRYLNLLRRFEMAAAADIPGDLQDTQPLSLPPPGLGPAATQVGQALAKPW